VEEEVGVNPSDDSSLRWRVLTDGVHAGAVNMARDHALARVLAPDTAVLRFYRWTCPTVSFGRNEPSRGLYDTAEATRQGVDFVRRPTGGRAVLHHLELTYCVIAPLKAFGGMKKTYRRINRGLVAGLTELGAPVEVAGRKGGALPPDAGPCFRDPTEGEVMAEGRKLVGSAQARVDGAILQHGSLILDGDQSLLDRLASGEEPSPLPATLSSLLGSMPEEGALIRALVTGLKGEFGGEWEDDALAPEEMKAAEALLPHYLDPEWLWRR
jgi:lipoate-protein ligase A